MRYAMAMICPPLALLSCHRSTQAIVATILYAVAIATARYGVGAFLEFFLILWATNAVGDEQARREARAFIATVKPIPVIRS